MVDAAGHAGQPGGTVRDPVALLPMVFARPARALAGARALLAGDPSPHDASIAHQVIGLVEREFGNTAAAVARLRQAVRLARGCGVPAREADTLASLGVALVHAGRTGPGLAALRRAVGLVAGHAAARVRFRLAGTLWVLGRHPEAYQEVRRAVPVLRRAGDRVWTARALTLRGLLHLARGDAGRAGRDFRAAEELYAGTDQEHDRAVAVHNRGLAALRAGDLPVALAHLDEAGARYHALGTPMPELAADRCSALLAAGLHQEALAGADQATAELADRRGAATRRAELVLAAARAALAAGDPATATARASAAGRLFAAQRRDWWAAHAQLLRLQSRFAAGGTGADLVRAATRLAPRLAALRSPETAAAYLLAGRAALAWGRPGQAAPLLAVAARARHRGPPLARVAGWLAVALPAAAAGDHRGTVTACRRGLAVLQAHHLTLGASELRAAATAHGAELAALAVRASLAAGGPRRLLEWSEHWRATALAVPPVRPPPDRQLRADLTRYRELTSRRPADHPTAGPDLRHWERRIQARLRHRPGAGTGRPDPQLDVGALLAALGSDTQLVEIVDVDGALQVLLCGDGRVRRYPAGSAAAAATEVGHARAALRRLAHGAAADPVHTAAGLAASARRLQELLLGPVVQQLREAVVVVPPGRLHAVPWAALPALAPRAVSVAPSARAWLRAARVTAPPGPERVLVVGGPGLPAVAAELAGMARRYPRATVLTGGDATAGRVLAALDGCGLAHLAVHGTFRADSPLFSSLRLADGPLTGYDLEQLRAAPHRLVLPSCDSARLAPTGADELVGLATALLPLGTVGLVASVVPVDDAATGPLMLALHDRLRAGTSLAEGLRAARATVADGDPVGWATAASFLALGAG